VTLRLVVGLGNFHASYEHTPHNVGFGALDVVVRRSKAAWRRAADCLVADIAGAVLAKPESYMNTCGPLVKRAQEKWSPSLERLLIVVDDFALPWGQLRFRLKGSSGGHNGLASVIESLGSENFPRLRVGIGPVPPGLDAKDYVLQRQPPNRLAELAEKAADALELALSEGLEKAMNRHNAKEVR
jgi:peptidyl-tRNA hydrolase, PTH1 family